MKNNKKLSDFITSDKFVHEMFMNYSWTDLSEVIKSDRFYKLCDKIL